MSTKPFKPVRKAVFPVAGLGTRFLPATKVMPKEMLPLAGKPLIQHAVEEAREAGIEELIFVTGRYKEMLEEHFDHQPELMTTLEARGRTDLMDRLKSADLPEGSLFLTRQPKPLGLGHAIWCARKLVGDEPFAVLLPDDVVQARRGCLSQMVDAYTELGGNLVAVMDVPREDTRKYGVVDPASDDGRIVRVRGLVEKPDPAKAPSTISIIGRYILQPEVFDHLAAFDRGAGGEIQLTDAMAKLIAGQGFHALRYEGTRYDCGSPAGFLQANLAWGLADPETAPALRDFMDRLDRGTIPRSQDKAGAQR
ncbi:MAG TPA: UTP--glucose-1-phosphate uridylyltransferase [Alphaproteobacteria bacterium]|nr:UTP--glucose-1-phosphate uridylyltransferase [Alphaproteobacteria bacterium]